MSSMRQLAVNSHTSLSPKAGAFCGSVFGPVKQRRHTLRIGNNEAKRALQYVPTSRPQFQVKLLIINDF